MTEILDVGCGEDYKGTVNVDLYPTRTFQSRYRGRPGYVRNLKKIPNFVEASINNLPFKNNSFDVVECHHLLEHIGVDLVQACRELLRVSRNKVVMTVPSSTCTSRLGTNHNKIVTRTGFHILFKNFRHKIEYSQFQLRNCLVPFALLSRGLRKRDYKGVPNPFFYMPFIIPTETKATVWVEE